MTCVFSLISRRFSLIFADFCSFLLCAFGAFLQPRCAFGLFWLLFFGRICKLTTLIIPRPARGILDVATLRSFCNFFREMILGAFTPSRRIEKFMLFRPVLYSFSGLDFVSIFDAFWLHFRTKNHPKWAKMGSGRVSKNTKIFGTCFS